MERELKTYKEQKKYNPQFGKDLCRLRIHYHGKPGRSQEDPCKDQTTNRGDFETGKDRNNECREGKNQKDREEKGRLSHLFSRIS